jgi:hypothetical protein
MSDYQFSETEIFIPRKEVLKKLNIGYSTLIEYLYFLNIKKPKGWDYQPYDKAFSLASLRVLEVFKTLIKRSRQYAINHINEYMEKLNNA